MKTDHFAVVVGIGKYPCLTDLAGPVNDAKAFRAWLVNPGGGDVDPANVHFQTTEDFHPPDPPGPKQTHPFDTEIRNLFYDLVRQTRDRDAWIGERLYIYMAGHGFTNPTADRQHLTGLYAANADNYEAGNVVGTMYAEWFRMWAGFHEIVLVMDCCRANDLVQQLNTTGLPGGKGRPGRAAEVRTFYAQATQPGMVARERAMNGGQVLGIFTRTLLDALDRAPPDPSGHVTGRIVEGYVHQNIRAVAGPVEVADPHFSVNNKKDIVLVSRAAAPGTRVKLLLDPFSGPVEVMILRGPSDVVHQMRVTAPNLTLHLAPGYYKAVVDGSDRHLFEVGGTDVEITC